MKRTYIVGAIAVIFLGLWYLDLRSVKPSLVQRDGALSPAVATNIVDLKDGDTFDLTIQKVKKKIAGKEVVMFGYNGSVPGPTIRVPQGAEITIRLKNGLGIPTTLHSHGVRVDNAFDGTPDVTQKEIPKDGSFTYKIKFPDAGVFWYHPHVREDYTQEMGLAGNFLVVSRDSTYWNKVDKEVPLMVDDILLDANGEVAAFGSVTNHALMGRFGNQMLVNGVSDYSLSVHKGEVARFYITNVANTRVFNLVIPGAKMKLVGSDNGKYERETFVDSVLIAPSERAVVEVLFETAGNFPIQHKTPQRTYVMGNITVAGENSSAVNTPSFLKLHTNKDIVQSIDAVRKFFNKKIDKNIALTVNMGAMGGGGHMMPDGSMMGGAMMENDKPGEKIEWEDTMAMMNQMATTNAIAWKIIDQDTQKAGMDIQWKFKVGDMVKVKIYNDPKSGHPMQHPIHIHGQRFLVLSTNGVKATNLVWKDTALIQEGDTVEILIAMENPGTWMTHCHISEHLEGGMMFNFTVEK